MGQTAYDAELAGHPDEPAHFVSGLMVRDYLLSGLEKSPLAYAREYYLHYPKIAIGVWGPGFYLIEGAWLALFPWPKQAALGLIAAIASLIALILAYCVQKRYGSLYGVLAGCLFLFLAEVRLSLQGVMLDGAITLVCLAAAICFGRYMQTGRSRDSAAFGFLASLGILMKGNAMLLAFVPPFAILLAGRWDLLRKANFWLAGFIVILLAGPWELYSYPIWSGLHDRFPGWTFIEAYALLLPAIVTPALFVFCLIGVARFLRKRRRLLHADNQPAAFLGLALATVLFYVLMPGAGAEARYLLSAAPPLLYFCCGGIELVAEKAGPILGIQPRIIGTAILTTASAGALLDGRWTPKPHLGYDHAAAFVRGIELGHDPVVLVCSDAVGEGAMVAEVATGDTERPQSYVVRASKVLADVDWNGQHYYPRFSESNQILKYLEQIPVDFVVMSSRAPYSLYSDLQKALSEAGGDWEMVRDVPNTAYDIQIYHRSFAPARPSRNLDLELPASVRERLNLLN